MNSIRFTDVTLRDGLQMEERVLSVAEKKSLLDALVGCGFSRIEVTSFVHPKWMPQFADAEQLSATLGSGATEWMAFVPNVRGLYRLKKFPIPWAAAFVAVTEAFNQKNVNAPVADTLSQLGELVPAAHAAGKKVRIYISTVFGCPYEGKVSVEQFDKVFAQVAQLGPDEICLGDTIGVAYPEQVDRWLAATKAHYPVEKLGLHFHNTYGLAVACAEAGYRAGVRIFDGATGGTGGCPYAKGASGNVATEDLHFAFARAGRMGSVDLKKYAAVFEAMEKAGLTVRSHLYELWKRGGTPFTGIGL